MFTYLYLRKNHPLSPPLPNSPIRALDKITGEGYEDEEQLQERIQGPSNIWRLNWEEKLWKKQKSSRREGRKKQSRIQDLSQELKTSQVVICWEAEVIKVTTV